MGTNKTASEIRTQTTAWENALHTLQEHRQGIHELWSKGNFDSIFFTGCGSTHYLARAAAALTQSLTGVAAWGGPASELLLHPQSVYQDGTRPLLVAVSRSAGTTETIMATEDFRERFGAAVIVISCYADRPLNNLGTINLDIPAGQEESIAQTRSFASMLVAAEGLARILAGQSAHPWFGYIDGHDFVGQAQSFATPFADTEKYDRYFYLGSGERYGVACEAMLKMKEMSQSYAEAYHPLEFRHGPKSMVNERTLVIGLLDEQGYDAELAVLDEMQALGATTLNLSANSAADFRLTAADDGAISLVAYLPLLQWMAYQRAINKALDPDKPHNLDMVVQL